jgi:hypothetical protein
LQSRLSHPKYADYQIAEWKQPISGEGPFLAVRVTAFEFSVIIDMVD